MSVSPTAPIGEKHYQVCIVGAGPTGLMLANLLGISEIHTLVVERNISTVGEPRAVSIDDESLRTTQAAGLVEPVLADCLLDYGSHYFSADGRCFAKVEPTTREFGYPRRSAFRQPLFEATLRSGLDRFDHVDIRFETELTDFSQDPNSVSVALAPASGMSATITCDYLAACDGGRSFVRNALGIPLLGSTFEQRWLIIDLLATKDTFRQTRIFSNPVRPGICLPGPHGTRRYEFMLNPQETNEEAEAEEFSRRLLHDHGPDGDTEIVRRQVYTFHARKAERWRKGRIFLLGDAAHLTPPFAGQGLNSGIRDAHNLAWKLTAVLRGDLPDTLLQTYEQERRPHAWALIELAMAIGRVMVPTSTTNAWIKQTLFHALDLWPPAKRYVSEMRFKPKPYYETGFLAFPDNGFAKKFIGRMMPQPLVENREGTLGLLDESLGDQFCALALHEDPVHVSSMFSELPESVQQVCITPKHIMPSKTSTMICVRDATGGFEQFARGAKSPIFFVRPDRYIADTFEAGTNVQVAKRLKSLFNSCGSK